VLVSYVFELDPGHEDARRTLEDIIEKGLKLYTSSSTLVELYNTICRKLIREGGRGLIKPLNTYAETYRSQREMQGYLINGD